MRAAENAAKKAEEELEAARKESEQLARQLERMKEVSQKRRVTVEEIRQKSGNTAAVQQLSERFAEAMDQYWRRKSAGASVNERIALLSQILQDFENTEIDLSIAQSEYEIAKSDRAKAEMDLQISWSYYQKIVARGASVPERIQLLGRMIERFARTGVDLSNLKTELKSL
jgi:small-conductance mechanosensitive channel